MIIVLKIGSQESGLRRRNFPVRRYPRSICAEEDPGETDPKQESVKNSSLSRLHYSPFSATLLLNT